MDSWDDFCQDVQGIFDSLKNNNNGRQATYIPQLAQVNPDLYGVSVYNVDGREFNNGDYEVDFCIQSCSKPLTFGMILEEHGLDRVSECIGREPSGASFNSFTFNRENKPFNPLINAGAIMACSLVKPNLPSVDRYEHIINKWKSIVGDNVGFDNSVYLSEKNTAYRNNALANLMMENGIFPKNTNIQETLELYFQACSITMNCHSMAKFAAMLANGGICVDTQERVLSPDVVKDVLCVMYSSGMYDYSGRWSFQVGLPAKSGVSGSIFVVVPKVCGICIYSPRLDEMGNSVRGVEFCQELVRRYKVHIFDTLVVGVGTQKKGIAGDLTSQCLFDMCKTNNYQALEKFLEGNDVDVNAGDYDDRRPLHIASEENAYECVKILLDYMADATLQDRWGNAPIDVINKHHEKGEWLDLKINKRRKIND
uniref:glutaminase n=1 Tax=Megaviridae environmental sample TaxID=1737588 RepID=A0A5J6VIE0_9VIRU|nr:MAG: glutaminase [Megaviridae environmental sample]